MTPSLLAHSSTHAQSLQWRLTLRPRGRSPPGTSLNGNLQGRTLEWAAVPAFRGSSCPGD